MRKSVAIWGPRPPPIGGVTRSVVLLHESLVLAGVRSEIVDTRSMIRALPRALTPGMWLAGLHVFNVSSFRSLILFGRLGMVVPGSSAALLHGMRFVEEDETKSPAERNRIARTLNRFNEVWVNNEVLQSVVASISPGLIPRLVSPSPSTVAAAPPDPAGTTDRTPTAVVGAYGGLDLYGIEIAIESVRLFRDAGDAYTLDVLLYGPDTPLRRRVAQTASDISWVTVHEELPHPDLSALLSRTRVLLRPTERDGDSLLVREALAAGCRVIASDVAPRPKGTEVVQRSSEAFAQAIQHGGPISDRSGLGRPVDLVVRETVAAD